MAKKNHYVGYPIKHNNVEVRLFHPPYYKHPRFCLYDLDLDIVFDNAQGNGYKTKKNALKAFHWKNNRSPESEENLIFYNWYRTHRDCCRKLDQFLFLCEKGHASFSNEQANVILRENSRMPLPFPVQRFLKWYC